MCRPTANQGPAYSQCGGLPCGVLDPHGVRARSGDGAAGTASDEWPRGLVAAVACSELSGPPGSNRVRVLPLSCCGPPVSPAVMVLMTAGGRVCRQVAVGEARMTDASARDREDGDRVVKRTGCRVFRPFCSVR